MMNSKKFIELVFTCMKVDGFNIYDAIFAVQHQHKIDNEELILIMKNEKTLLADFTNYCENFNIIDKKNVSKDISDLF